MRRPVAPLEATVGGERRDLTGWALPVLLIVAGLVLWELTASISGVPKWLLPSPADIVGALIGSWGLIWQHTVVTLQEVLVGFGIALVVGVAIAIAIAYSRTVERALYPIVVASQTVPVVAIAPILLIWFGYGLLPKVIVVALICFFPIVVNMVDGLRSVDPDLVSLMRSMGATRWQLFTKAQVQTSLPFLMSGTKVAVAVSVIGAVMGEWVGASAGLGYFMVRSASQFQTARVFAAVLVLSAMGVALFALTAILERYLLPWYHDPRRDAAGRP